MFRPFWGDSFTITTFWGDQPAGKVAINCTEMMQQKTVGFCGPTWPSPPVPTMSTMRSSERGTWRNANSHGGTKKKKNRNEKDEMNNKAGAFCTDSILPWDSSPFLGFGDLRCSIIVGRKVSKSPKSHKSISRSKCCQSMNHPIREIGVFQWDGISREMTSNQRRPQKMTSFFLQRIVHYFRQDISHY